MKSWFEILENTNNNASRLWERQKESILRELAAETRDQEAELEGAKFVLEGAIKAGQSIGAIATSSIATLSEKAVGYWDMQKQAVLMELAAGQRDWQNELKSAKLIIDGTSKTLKMGLNESCILLTGLSHVTFSSEERKEIKNLNAQLLRQFDGAKLGIYIQRHQIKNDQLIVCKGEISVDGRPKHEVSCLVACGHLTRLLDLNSAYLSSEERQRNAINILNHLDKLMPRYPHTKLGLVTFQNGINNTFDHDFQKLGEAITSKFRELNKPLPLCIGLYNPSLGFGSDFFKRMAPELRGRLSNNVFYTRQMFITIADLMSQNHPEVLWTHIAHSEAGLIANLAVETLPKKCLNYIKKRLVVAAYGAVQPFPKTPYLETFNTYSTEDVALFFGLKYKRWYTDYDIKIVNSINSKSLSYIEEIDQYVDPGFSFPEGDHDFVGKTYQKVLENNLQEILQMSLRSL